MNGRVGWHKICQLQGRLSLSTDCDKCAMVNFWGKEQNGEKKEIWSCREKEQIEQIAPLLNINI